MDGVLLVLTHVAEVCVLKARCYKLTLLSGRVSNAYIEIYVDHIFVSGLKERYLKDLDQLISTVRLSMLAYASTEFFLHAQQTEGCFHPVLTVSSAVVIATAGGH